MRSFLLGRIKLVNELITSGPDVEYADLVLILTAVLSACAAMRWPGNGRDRKRFVELLVGHSKPDAHCDYVCVPGLVNKGLVSESDTPWGKPGEFTRVLRDEQVDVPISAARSRFPRVPISVLREHSYAALIYSWLRCPYAHEYCMKEFTSQVPASRQPARISYIGRPPADGRHFRVATFHLDYLVSLATHHAESCADAPQPEPQKWWLELP